MSIGLLSGLLIELLRGRWHWSLTLLLLPALISQTFSALNLFIGPIADAEAYTAVLNSCRFSLEICGEKPHTQIWGVVASITGPAWPVIYGGVIFRFIKSVDNIFGNTIHNPFIFAFKCLAIYQISNGMAELTYCIIITILVDIIYKKENIYVGNFYKLPISILLYSTAVASHPGNLFSISLFFKRWKLFIISVILMSILFSFFGNELVSISNKSSALEFQGDQASIIAGKLQASEKYGETSYANWLYGKGFPYNIKSILFSICAFAAPIVVFPKDAITIIISLISTFMSICIFYLCAISRGRKRVTAVMAVVICFIVFGYYFVSSNT